MLSLILLGISSVSGAAKNHRYEPQEEVPLYANKIGPYANPSETYEYYSLPFCEPENIQHKHETLGEALDGDVMLVSAYELPFATDVPWRSLCKLHLGAKEIKKFQRAVSENYYFEFVYDDLPVRGFIGATERELAEDGTEETRQYLYTHLHFDISHNGNQIIHVNVSADPTQAFWLHLESSEPTAMIKFSYSATWSVTDIPFSQRRAVFADFSFFPRELEIHWLSIMNSCVLVVLLTGFLAMIVLRVLKNDYTRYTRQIEQADDQDDYGWKLLHGDVFRFPRFLSVFTALLGIGAQFIVLCGSLLLVALASVYYQYSRGFLYALFVSLYALTSGIAGFVAASYYKSMGGDKWVWNIMLTATLFVGPAVVVAAVLNAIALLYSSTQALPIRAVIVFAFISLFVGLPLTVVGGILGRKNAAPFEAPTRTMKIMREIPEIPWYRRTAAQMCVAGFLPFSAIYIELYYVYVSVWGHKTYTLFGILALVFVIVIVVTACITVCLTYFQLALEDHRWWWRSFLSAGSTGIFMFLYSTYFYFQRSQMSGFLQMMFFFGYTGVICYAFFIMLGTVGFFSSLVFVRRIYSALKSD